MIENRYLAFFLVIKEKLRMDDVLNWLVRIYVSFSDLNSVCTVQ